KVIEKNGAPSKTPMAASSPKVDAQAAREANKARIQKERKLRALEDKIAEKESALSKIREELAGDHGSDWQKLHSKVDEQKALEKEVADLMQEWERLSV